MMKIKDKKYNKVYEYDYKNILFKSEVFDEFRKRAVELKLTNSALLQKLLNDTK